MDKLKLQEFTTLLKQLLNEGYGELSLKIEVRDGTIDYVAISKANTYQIKSDIINL